MLDEAEVLRIKEQATRTVGGWSTTDRTPLDEAHSIIALCNALLEALEQQRWLAAKADENQDLWMAAIKERDTAQEHERVLRGLLGEVGTMLIARTGPHDEEASLLALRCRDAALGGAKEPNATP